MMILMLNKSLDLKNYFTLLHKSEFEATASNYADIINSSEVYKVSHLDADNNLHLLNPALFSRLFFQGLISSEDALVALSRILTKLQL